MCKFNSTFKKNEAIFLFKQKKQKPCNVATGGIRVNCIDLEGELFPWGNEEG